MKLLLQRILSLFNRKGVTAHQKWLPSHQSRINEEISFSDRCLTHFQVNRPKVIGSGSISGKIYSSRFLESSLQNQTETDLIANDPFFSQVEKTINNVGLEKASEMLGTEVINIYTKLVRKRLERLYLN
jgi:ferredoxin-NADP reductase